MQDKKWSESAVREIAREEAKSEAGMVYLCTILMIGFLIFGLWFTTRRIEKLELQMQQLRPTENAPATADQ